MGQHLLIRGDARRLPIDLSRVDAVVTDPPYGVGDTPERRRPTKWQRAHGDAAREWDRFAPELAWLADARCPVVVWGGNYFGLPPSRGWLAWHKPDAVPSMASVELAWTNLDRNARHITYSIGATNPERVGHPTQKPVAVMRWTLEFLGLPPGSVVLDPYMGSGTTALAAAQLGLSFVGLDIDARYVTLARRRVERPHAPVPRHRDDATPLPLFSEMAP